eukprot:scaffold3943_cov123-Isochrysis_galbana.AAC.3
MDIYEIKTVKGHAGAAVVQQLAARLRSIFPAASTDSAIYRASRSKVKKRRPAPTSFRGYAHLVARTGANRRALTLLGRGKGLLRHSFAYPSLARALHSLPASLLSVVHARCVPADGDRLAVVLPVCREADQELGHVLPRHRHADVTVGPGHFVLALARREAQPGRPDYHA